MNDWTIEQVMGSVAPHIDDLDQIPRLAHGLYRTYPAHVLTEHDVRAEATCIYCHMVAEADRRLTGRPGIVTRDINGLKVWLIGDKVVLRFKKMNEDGQSSNYPTAQAKDYDRGEMLPGLPPEAARISAGYLLNETHTEIVRVQIARPMGVRRVLWNVAIVPASENAQRWVEITRQRNLG